MRVIIVGGGVGGLAAALTLNARGIEAEVFEQAAEIRELGVGINTLPHAIKELAGLGLLDQLDAVGVRTEELIYKTGRGQDILRQKRGVAAGYDHPQFSIHRGKLQGVLAAAARERLGAGRVQTDRRLVRFSQSSSGVEAVFADRDGAETVVSGDVLVGADGIHSAVRQHYHPDQGPPRWNGMVMWRGATWRKPFLTGRSMIIAGGMNAKLVLYPIFYDEATHPGLVLTNWVVGAKIGDAGGPPPSREDWSAEGRLEDVLGHVRGVLSIDELDIEEMIRATPAFYVYPMADRDPLERWSDGRVTLLGDAAHPMYPVGSNGASQAILDAVALAGHLAEWPDDPVEALAAYEAERLPATADLVRLNRQGGPERVIDLVEERAPDGFSELGDVATPEELTAIVGAYQTMAGFDLHQVNEGAPQT